MIVISRTHVQNITQGYYPDWRFGGLRGKSPVFSLLFEVADKSLKVADSAIHHTCVGGGCHLRGSVTEEWRIQRSGQRGFPRHRMSKRNAEHLGREGSGGRRGTALLEGGLGVSPKTFFKFSHEMVNSGGIYISQHMKSGTLCQCINFGINAFSLDAGT